MQHLEVVKLPREITTDVKATYEHCGCEKDPFTLNSQHTGKRKKMGERE